MKPKGWLVVDGNALGYAAMHTGRAGAPNRSVNSILNSLYQIKGWQSCQQLVVLWDGVAQWRFDLCPGYKAQRDNNEKQAAIRKDYRSQREIIYTVLNELGVRQVLAPSFEADDIAGFLVRKANGLPVTLVTGDLDWCQLVSRPEIRWFDPRSGGKHITFENFKEKTGYLTVDELIAHKALLGDSSDNIHGLRGFGPKCGDAVKAHFKSIQHVRDLYAANGPYTKDNAPDGFPSRHITALNHLCEPEGEYIYLRNLKLMNLNSPMNDKEMAKEVRCKPSFLDTKGDIEDFLLDNDLDALIPRLSRIRERLTGE